MPRPRCLVRASGAIGVALVALGTLSLGSTVDTADAQTTGGSYVPVPVARLLDTRGDLDAAIQVAVGKVQPGQPLRAQIAGMAGIPNSGVAAVDLNIAVTAVEGRGFLAVYPCADGNDGTARLNYTPRPELGASAIAVQVLAQLDEDGAVCIEASQPAHVIVDTSGYLPDGGPLRPVSATRLFDTRDGTGAVPVPAEQPAVRTPFEIEVAGVAGVPTTGASAVLLSVAAVNGATNGFVSVFPCADGYQETANLNHRAGAPIANSVIAPLDPDGRICFYTTTPVDLVVDLSAWFAADAAFGALAPARAADTRDGTGGIPIGPLVPFTPQPIALAGVGGVPEFGVDAVSLNVAAARGAAAGFLAIFPCDEEWNGTASLNFQAGEPISNGALTPIAADGTACVLSNRAVDVVIDVNGWFGVEPSAVDDTFDVVEDAPASRLNVLANDDGAASITSVGSVTQPANGTVVIVDAGAAVTYVPDADYCNTGAAPDEFTYTSSPGGSVATVSVGVTCVDDAPSAVGDDGVGFDVVEDDPAVEFDVLANDLDIDGGLIAVGSVTQPANGTVVIVDAGAAVTYAPDADYCNTGAAPDEFTYTLSPGGSVATVSVRVSCVNDEPVAFDDRFESDAAEPGGPDDRNAVGNTRLAVGTGSGGVPARSIAGSLLDNDIDGDDGQVDADTLVVVDVQTSGSLSAVTDQGGTVAVAADGAFVYDPPVGFEGFDSFAYTISDGEEQAVASAVIEVVDLVWYVDSSVDTVFSGTGTSGDPYSRTDAVRSTSGDIDEPGDIIFLYQGTSDGTAGNAYQGGLAVEENQRVVGEPAGLTVDGVELVPPDPGFPEVTSTVGAGIDISSGARLDSVHSITTGSSPGIQIAFADDVELHDVGHSGSGSSGLYVLDVAGPIVSTGTITIDGEDVLSNAGILVETPQSAGTVTIANVDIDAVSGDGIRVEGALGGGDGAVTINDGTIDGSSGYGVNLDNGDGAITIDADIGTTTSNIGPLRVFDRKGGDVSFGGSVFDSSDNDLEIGGTNNTGTAIGTVTFTGPVTLQSATGIGGDGTGILVEGPSNVPAPDSTMTVDFDGPVRVLDKINGFSIRATGTHTLRLDGGLEIDTGATVALGLWVGSATVEITDAPGVAETISTNSGATIQSTNGSGTLTLDSVSGSSMIVLHTLPEAGQHVDIDALNLTGGNFITLFLGGAPLGLDSARIGGGSITASNGGAIDIQNVPDVDIDLSLVDVSSDGGNTEAVFVTGTGGDIDITSLVANDVGDGVVLANNSATISFGSIDIGDPGSSPSNRGVVIFDSTGAVDLGTGDITSAGGDAFVVDGGANPVTYSGTITNSANSSVLVRDRTGGTVTFNGLVTHTGTSVGVDTSNNAAGSTLRFAGGLGIDVTGDVGLLLTAGVHEIVDPVVGSNTVSATGGPAPIFLNGATIGAAGITLESVGANGSTDGIVLTSVGGTGPFRVTGTGANHSGGSITANTHGVELVSVTAPVVLTELSIAATSGSGILADRTSSLTVDGVSITRWASSLGNAGISSVGFESGARSVTLQGTNSRNFISNLAAGSVGSGVALTASAGDYDIVIDETDFSNVVDGVSLRPGGTARFDAVVGDPGSGDASSGGGRVTSIGATGTGVQVDVVAGSSTLLIDELVTDGVLGPGGFDSGVVLTTDFSGQLDAVIEDSTIGWTIPLRTNGLFVGPGDGTIRLAVRNVVAIADEFDGARLVVAGSGELDATIDGSEINGVTGLSSTGLFVRTTTSAASVCLDATDNTFSGVLDDLVIDQEPGSMFDIAGLSGGSNAAAVDAYLQVTNTYVSGGSTIVGTSFTGFPCTLPTIP
jgi:hypothetical protein